MADAFELLGIKPSKPLVDAVVKQGSGGRDYAANGQPLTSPKGARYKMQVMPATAADPGYGVTPAQDDSPEEYNRVGEDYLQAMMDRYDGNTTLGFAAYNAGPDSVDRWIQQHGDPRTGEISDHDFQQRIPYAETKEYVQKVQANLGNAQTMGAAETLAGGAGRDAFELLGVKPQPASKGRDAFELLGVKPQPASKGRDAFEVVGIEPPAQKTEKDREQEEASWGEAFRGYMSTLPPSLEEQAVGLAQGAIGLGNLEKLAADKSEYTKQRKQLDDEKILGASDYILNAADQGLLNIKEGLTDISGAVMAPFSAAVREVYPSVEEDLTFAADAARGRIEQRTPRIKDKLSAKNIVTGAAPSIVQNLPAIAASILSKNPEPALLAMGLGSGGQAMSRQLDAGKSPAEAVAAGAGYAGAEILGERLPLGVLLDESLGTIKKIGFSVLTDALGEGFTQLLQSGIDKETINPQMTLRDVLEDIAVAGAQGAVSGGLFGTIAAAGGRRPVRSQRKEPPEPPSDGQPPPTPGATPPSAPGDDMGGVVAQPDAMERTRQRLKRDLTPFLWNGEPVEMTSEPPVQAPDGRMMQKVIYNGQPTLAPVDEISANRLKKPSQTASGKEVKPDEQAMQEGRTQEVAPQGAAPSGVASPSDYESMLADLEKAHDVLPEASPARDILKQEMKKVSDAAVTALEVKRQQQEADESLQSQRAARAEKLDVPSSTEVADEARQRAEQDKKEERQATITARKVERAAAEVATPTEAQKESGTYKKGHVSLHGMNIAIETAKGMERTGTDKDGESWSVTMPAHYGYIKRTEGADGEQVDAYIGQNPASQKVYVIDQNHADTGKFDEGKVMLGYDSQQQALADYEKAFSDGRGKDRIGGVTEMTVPEFKEWLKSGNTKKPVKQEIPLTGRTRGKRRKAPPPTKRQSLFEFWAAHGGIEDARGELKNRDLHLWHKKAKFRGKLVKDIPPDQADFVGKRESRQSEDEQAYRAWEAGYFPEFPKDGKRPTFDEIMKVVDARGGDNIFQPDNFQPDSVLKKEAQNAEQDVASESNDYAANLYGAAPEGGFTDIRQHAREQGIDVDNLSEYDVLRELSAIAADRKYESVMAASREADDIQDSLLDELDIPFDMEMIDAADESGYGQAEGQPEPSRADAPEAERPQDTQGAAREAPQGRADNAERAEDTRQGRDAGAEGSAGVAPTNLATDGGKVFIDSTDAEILKSYPMAGNTVDGLTVRGDVPNESSIGATIDNYERLKGIRDVSLSYFPAKPEITARTKGLAAEIAESGEINPLIVAVDQDGAYILEGGHRYDALQILGKSSFPAVVVLDLDSLPSRNTPPTPAKSTTSEPKAPVVNEQTTNKRFMVDSAPNRVGLEKAPYAKNLDGTSTGWKIINHPYGAVLINPDTLEQISFLTKKQRSGTELIRQRATAQAYAIDNPISRPQSEPAEMVVKPLYERGQEQTAIPSTETISDKQVVPYNQDDADAAESMEFERQKAARLARRSKPVSKETFQKLGEISSKLDDRANERYDELTNKGMSHSEAEADPLLKELTDKRIEVDTQAERKAFFGARHILEKLLEGKFTEGNNASIDGTLQKYYLNENESGGYFLRKLGQDIGKPSLIKRVGEDISRMLFTKEHPYPADYDAAMNYGMTGLSGKQKDDIKRRGFEIATEFDSKLREFITDELPASWDNVINKTPEFNRREAREERSRKETEDWLARNADEAMPAQGAPQKSEQLAITGTEPISDKQLAERGMEGRKQAKVNQKPAGSDGGLFDVGERNQQDMFSRKAKTQEQAENVLVLQHNLTEANLLHADKIGGIAAPSLAITKKDSPLTGFGEITLLGSPEMADPRGTSGIKVFGADIYSPRYPKISYEVKQKLINELDASLIPYQKKYGGSLFYDQNQLRDGYENIMRSAPFMAKYAEEKGISPEPEMDAQGNPDQWDNRTNLEQAIRKAGLQEEYELHSRATFDGLVNKEKIFMGFTNSGNRKYIEHSLDNVIKILKKEIRGGESFNYGVGSLRSKFTPQFKSITDIRKNKDRLLTKQDFEKIKKEIDDEFFTLADEMLQFYKYKDSNRFGQADTLINALGDSAKGGLTRSLSEYGFDNISDDTLKKAVGFLEKLRHLPTEYFEAKILRGVSVGEFSGAVVPHGTSKTALDILEKNGIKDIRFYERNNDIDRANKVGEFQHLLFSRTPSAPSGLTKADVTAAITKRFGKHAKKLIDASRVQIVQSVDEIDVGAKMYRDTQGFYHSDDGTVFLVADNLASMKEAENVFIHEAGVHAGMRTIMGEQFDKLLDTLMAKTEAARKKPVNERTPLEKALIKANDRATEAAKKKDGSFDPALVKNIPEETLAYMVDAAPDLPLVKRIISAVKRWLNTNFGIGELSPEDYRQIAIGAIRGWAKSDGAAGGGMYSKAGKLITDSAAFRKWFGDSKVVDGEGKPLVVYHGTRSDGVDSFRDFGAEDFNEQPSFFFSDSGDIASTYAEANLTDYDAPNVIPVYLYIERPLIVDAGGSTYRDIPFRNGKYTSDYIATKAAQAGYDGLIIKDVRDDFSSSKSKSSSTIYVAFSPTQIKSIHNRGTFDPNDARILYSRASRTKAVEVKERGKDGMNDLKRFWKREFTREGLLPKPVFEQKIYYEGGMNADERDIELITRGFEKSVADAYGKPYGKLEDSEKSLLRDYLAGMDVAVPEKVKKSLGHMRSYLDRGSARMIDAINKTVEEKIAAMTDKAKRNALLFLDTNGEEGSMPEHLLATLRLLQTIEGNKGRYLNRSYQAFDDEKWKDKVLKDKDLMARATQFIADRDIASKVSDSSGWRDADDFEEAFVRYWKDGDEKALYAALEKRLLDNAMREISEEEQDAYLYEGTVRKNPDAAITRANKRFDAILSRMEENREETEESLLNDAEIEGSVKDILESAKEKGNFVSFLSGGAKVGAKDVTFLKKRKDIDPVIRELLGEYTDPKVNFVKTASKMSKWLNGHYFLTGLKKMGLNSFLFTRPTGDYHKPVAGENSDPMSPLNGLYGTVDFVQGLEDAKGITEIGGWARRYLQFIDMPVKYGYTILSPDTQFRNFLSSAFQLLRAGHFNFKYAGMAMQATKADLFTHDNQWRDYTDKLIRLGVLHSSPRSAELKAAIKEAIDMNYLTSGGTFKTILRTSEKLYQAGDDFWKIIGFENEKALLMKYHGLDAAQADKKAAARIRDMYATYSMVPKFIKSLRRAPLIGAFPSFTWELYRTTKNMALVMKEDFDAGATPMLVYRSIGLAIAAGAAHAAAEMAKWVLGYDDDDDEAVHNINAPWTKNSTFLYLKPDENGHPRYFDMSWLDFYSGLKKPITALLNGNNETFTDKVLDAMGESLSPFLGVDIAASAIGEIYYNRTQGGRQVYNEQDTRTQQAKDIGGHLSKLAPGAVRLVKNMYKAVDGQVDPYTGKQYEVSDAVIAFFGFRFTTMNPSTATRYSAIGFKYDKQEAEDILRQPLSSQNKITDAEITDSFERMVGARDKVYRKMLKHVSAARKLGLTDPQIATALRNGMVGQEDTAFLMQGKIKPWFPSEEYMKKFYTSAMDGAYDAERRQEIGAELRRRMKIIKTLARERMMEQRTKTEKEASELKKHPQMRKLMSQVAPAKGKTLEKYLAVLG